MHGKARGSLDPTYCIWFFGSNHRFSLLCRVCPVTLSWGDKSDLKFRGSLLVWSTGVWVTLLHVGLNLLWCLLPWEKKLLLGISRAAFETPVLIEDGGELWEGTIYLLPSKHFTKLMYHQRCMGGGVGGWFLPPFQCFLPVCFKFTFCLFACLLDLYRVTEEKAEDVWIPQTEDVPELRGLLYL